VHRPRGAATQARAEPHFRLVVGGSQYRKPGAAFDAPLGVDDPLLLGDGSGGAETSAFIYLRAISPAAHSPTAF